MDNILNTVQKTVVGTTLFLLAIFAAVTIIGGFAMLFAYSIKFFFLISGSILFLFICMIGHEIGEDVLQ